MKLNEPSTNCLAYVIEARAAMAALEIELKAIEAHAKANKCNYGDSGSAFELQCALVECSASNRGVWSNSAKVTSTSEPT